MRQPKHKAARWFAQAHFYYSYWIFSIVLNKFISSKPNETFLLQKLAETLRLASTHFHKVKKEEFLWQYLFNKTFLNIFLNQIIINSMHSFPDK